MQEQLRESLQILNSNVLEMRSNNDEDEICFLIYPRRTNV